MRARRLVLIPPIVLSAAVLVGVAGAAAGDLDPSFGSGGKVFTDFGLADGAYGVVVQPDGKIVAVGYANTGGYAFLLARYNPDGSLDPTFGAGGKVRTEGTGLAHAVVLQPDGKIVVAGASGAFVVARYHPDGSLDSSFGAGGVVQTDVDPEGSDRATAVALQEDGKIVVGGYTRPIDEERGDDFALVRYKPNGRLDRTFGSGGKVVTDVRLRGWDLARGVAVQKDGRILLFGDTVGFGSFWALVRYRSDGSLDPSFGSGGKVLTDVGGQSYDWGFAIALQPDERIVAGGFNGDDIAVVRYLLDGSLDPSFGAGGKVWTDLGGSWDRADGTHLGGGDDAHAVALQPDGKIVAAGSSDAKGDLDFALARYDGE
jgi:uncharacterized delta-60 repeat protein